MIDASWKARLRDFAMPRASLVPRRQQFYQELRDTWHDEAEHLALRVAAGHAAQKERKSVDEFLRGPRFFCGASTDARKVFLPVQNTTFQVAPLARRRMPLPWSYSLHRSHHDRMTESSVTLEDQSLIDWKNTASVGVMQNRKMRLYKTRFGVSGPFLRPLRCKISSSSQRLTIWLLFAEDLKRPQVSKYPKEGAFYILRVCLCYSLYDMHASSVPAMGSTLRR
jgi:hypothetical protein